MAFFFFFLCQTQKQTNNMPKFKTESSPMLIQQLLPHHCLKLTRRYCVSLPHSMSRVNSGTSTLCFASRDLAPGDEVKHVPFLLLLLSSPASCYCLLLPVIASCLLDLLLYFPPASRNSSCNRLLPPGPPPPVIAKLSQSLATKSQDLFPRKSLQPSNLC